MPPSSPARRIAKALQTRRGRGKQAKAVAAPTVNAAAEVSSAVVQVDAAAAAAAPARHIRGPNPEWEMNHAFFLDRLLAALDEHQMAFSCLCVKGPDGALLKYSRNSHAFTLVHPSTKPAKDKVLQANKPYRFIRVFKHNVTGELRVSCSDLLAAFGGEDNGKQQLWPEKFPGAKQIDVIGGQSPLTLSKSDFILYVALVNERYDELQGADAKLLLDWTQENGFGTNLFAADTQAARMGRHFVQAVLDAWLSKAEPRFIQLSGQGFDDPIRAAFNAGGHPAALAAFLELTATEAATALAAQAPALLLPQPNGVLAQGQGATDKKKSVKRSRAAVADESEMAVAVTDSDEIVAVTKKARSNPKAKESEFVHELQVDAAPDAAVVEPSDMDSVPEGEEVGVAKQYTPAPQPSVEDPVIEVPQSVATNPAKVDNDDNNSEAADMDLAGDSDATPAPELEQQPPNELGDQATATTDDVFTEHPPREAAAAAAAAAAATVMLPEEEHVPSSFGLSSTSSPPLSPRCSSPQEEYHLAPTPLRRTPMPSPCCSPTLSPQTALLPLKFLSSSAPPSRSNSGASGFFLN